MAGRIKFTFDRKVAVVGLAVTVAGLFVAILSMPSCNPQPKPPTIVVPPVGTGTEKSTTPSGGFIDKENGPVDWLQERLNEARQALAPRPKVQPVMEGDSYYANSPPAEAATTADAMAETPPPE